MSLQGFYDMSPPIMQNVLMNLHGWRIERHRYGRLYRQRLRWLLSRERLDPAARQAWQLDRVRSVCEFAMTHSPFYRERFAAVGFDPSRMTSLEDLSEVPLTTKQDVRDHADAIRTAPTPRRGWLYGHTSGTTGAPLSLWYDRETCITTNSVDRQYKSWGGAADGEWVGLLLGRTVVPPSADSGAFWRVNRVQRQVWFSSFHLRDDWMPAYVEEIRRRGLRFLEGYPSTLFVLARHLRARGERLALAAAFSSSETLHETQRETIEEAFDCPLFDYYGSAERTVYAGECEAHSGKHISEEFGYVEVVNASGVTVSPGETGFIVGTSLWNRAFPMIRYQSADVSSLLPGECGCGRTARRIADVTTKQEDLLVASDGRFISPSALTHPFKPLKSIVESQIIQEAVDDVRVLLVTRGGMDNRERAELLEGLRLRLGTATHVRLEEVESIPRERSGKFRWVISKVHGHAGPHPDLRVGG